MSVPWVLNVRRSTDADKSPHFCGETDALRIRLCVYPARTQETLPVERGKTPAATLCLVNAGLRGV
jgi:hypothetical protein